MLYHTCNTIPSVNFARYGVSCAKDLGILETCHIKPICMYRKNSKNWDT